MCIEGSLYLHSVEVNAALCVCPLNTYPLKAYDWTSAITSALGVSPQSSRWTQNCRETRAGEGTGKEVNMTADAADGIHTKMSFPTARPSLAL